MKGAKPLTLAAVVIVVALLSTSGGAVARPLAAACEPDSTLDCGDTDSWNTTWLGSTDQVDSYSCMPSWDESGQEYAYEFTPTQTVTATATLSNMTVDLDVFALQDTGAGCDPSDCIAFGDDSATFTAQAGETYYIVVDGYEGEQGAYTIELSCPPSPRLYLPLILKNY